MIQGARALPGRVYTLSEAARLTGLSIKRARTSAKCGCPFNWGRRRYRGKKRRLYDPSEVRLYYRTYKRRLYHTIGEPDHRAGVIYAICEPNGAIRYIGKTGDFKKRCRGHRSSWHKRKGNPHLWRWANKLIAQGKQPVFRIVQECLPGTMDECEREWIARGKAKGWKLCNMNEGGEGGKTLHDDAKRRISEISKARWQTPEYQERWVKAMAGRARILSDEEREKRKQQRQRNLETHRYNMAVRAARVAKAEEKNLWVFVPLTRKATAFVPLTNSKWAMVDVGDWDRVNQCRWSAVLKGGKYWRAKSSRPLILMNRYVMQADESQFVRHANGNQLDCRRANLIVNAYRVRGSGPVRVRRGVCGKSAA